MSVALLNRPWTATRKPQLTARKNFSNSVYSGLIGLWNLSEGGGTTPIDSSSFYHTTPVFNDAPIWVPTIYGPGVSFDGVNDRIDFATATSDPLAVAFSLDEGSLWVRFKRTFPDTTSDSATMFMVKDTPANSKGNELVQMFWQTSPDTWRCNLKTTAGTVNVDLASGLMPQDAWNDLLFTWSLANDEFLIYLDGTLIDSGTHPGASTNSVRGIYWIDPRNPEGTSILSDIAFWNRPLTTKEAIGMSSKPYAQLYYERGYAVSEAAAAAEELAIRMLLMGVGR